MGIKTEGAREKSPSERADTCRRRFLKFFPKGFHDPKYIDWERGYKWTAHEQWNEVLSREKFRAMLKKGQFAEIAAHAVRIESKTNLLFSFEKMALRDGVKSADGARIFAEGLDKFLHAAGQTERKFERWCEALAALPRRQTRVLTWPTATIFPFLAQPGRHIFLKPNTTRRAAREYDFPFQYQSTPNWETYANLLDFADMIRRDQSDLRPRDMIDLQSFIWVIGSDEYAAMA
jgi:hypothetical protein